MIGRLYLKKSICVFWNNFMVRIDKVFSQPFSIIRSKIAWVMNRAVNMLATIPKVRVTAKPRTEPEPYLYRKIQVIRVVRFESRYS